MYLTAQHADDWEARQTASEKLGKADREREDGRRQLLRSG